MSFDSRKLIRYYQDINKILSKTPKLMLSNVMSLALKIDEVSIRNEINLAFITETWLKETVSDSIVDIPHFILLRRDRKLENHGGVCVYIKETQYKHKRLDDLCLWIYLRPNRLPQGLLCIIAVVIYHPPGADGKLMQDHLFQTLTLVEYPNCGIIVTGDFNSLSPEPPVSIFTSLI